MLVEKMEKREEDLKKKHYYNKGFRCENCGKLITNKTKTKKCKSCAILGHPGYLKKHTKETREKLSLALTGRKLSRKTKEKLRKINLGKKHTEETKERQRISHPPKQGLTIDPRGYYKSYCPKHPKANYGRVRTQIIIMEKHIGRYLREGEIVHHKNCNKKDNRIKNLVIVTMAEHRRIHAKLQGKHSEEHRKKISEALKRSDVK